MLSPDRSTVGERVLVAGAAVAFALPLLASPYVPGGDTPWHAAVLAVLAAGDDAGDQFLGAFETDDSISGYSAAYRLLALLARLVGAPGAIQILSVIYIITFVWGAHRLARAFGANGVVALLAAPAAYSTTMEFGFIVYLPTLPLTLWLWALIREVMVGRPLVLRAAVIAASWIGICLCHPFAAAIAALGSGLLIATHFELGVGFVRRAGVVAGILVVGALPAVIALHGVADSSEPRLYRAAGTTLWDRLTTQVFVPPWESVSRAPERLFGYVGTPWRLAFAISAIGLVLAWRRASLAVLSVESGSSRRAPLYLLALLVALYLVTPFTFEWPRNWYGAQPRILPLVWVVGLVAIRPGMPLARWPRVAVVGLATAAWALLVLQALVPDAADARDLAQVIERSAPRQRTLGLIEQPRTVERMPPSPFRNATAWVVAERGGVSSHLPIAKPHGLNTGQHIPVRAARGAPPLPAEPPLAVPRAFRWEQHAAGWQQFLVRDTDPDHPHDYFGAHANEVELVARAGRWRLYRRADLSR